MQDRRHAPEREAEQERQQMMTKKPTSPSLESASERMTDLIDKQGGVSGRAECDLHGSVAGEQDERGPERVIKQELDPSARRVLLA